MKTVNFALSDVVDNLNTRYGFEFKWEEEGKYERAFSSYLGKGTDIELQYSPEGNGDLDLVIRVSNLDLEIMSLNTVFADETLEAAVQLCRGAINALGAGLSYMDVE